jgi:hypothetical protein
MRIWHALWLDRIDRKIAYVQQRQAEEEHGRARRPPTPDWILELNRATGHPLAVRVGDCGMTGHRTQPVGHDDARRLLTTDRVPACPICRPDTELHIVDLLTLTKAVDHVTVGLSARWSGYGEAPVAAVDRVG